MPLSDGEIQGNQDKRFKLDCGEEGSQDEMDEIDGNLQVGLQVGENSGDKLVEQQDAACEAEREKVPQRGEEVQHGNNLSFEWYSICEFWIMSTKPRV